MEYTDTLEEAIDDFLDLLEHRDRVSQDFFNKYCEKIGERFKRLDERGLVPRFDWSKLKTVDLSGQPEGRMVCSGWIGGRYTTHGGSGKEGA